MSESHPSGSESPLQFPCVFPIKAVGKAGEGFVEIVVEIVARHAPGFDSAAVTLRESSGGQWLSVTVAIEANSRDQLDAIYRDLTAHERVVWAI